MSGTNASHTTLLAGIGILASNGNAGSPKGIGTLTGLATRDSDGEKVLVTNLHVVSVNTWTISGGEVIYQGGNKVGQIHSSIKVTSGGYNIADVATCEILSGVDAEFTLHDHPTHSQRTVVAGVVDPTEGMVLTMLGAKSGESTVTVKEINQIKQVDKFEFTGVTILDCSQEPVSHGDSGSPCLFSSSPSHYQMSCILFARHGIDDSIGYAFPASVAEKLLGITFGDRPPVASATASPLAVTTGSIVTLDGSGSTDPDGDALTYLWEQVDGRGGGGIITLSNPTSVSTTFIAPPGPATLEFNLTVTDSYGLSDTTSVKVSVWEHAHVQLNGTIEQRGQFPYIINLSGNLPDWLFADEAARPAGSFSYQPFQGQSGPIPNGGRFRLRTQSQHRGLFQNFQRDDVTLTLRYKDGTTEKVYLTNIEKFTYGNNKLEQLNFRVKTESTITAKNNFEPVQVEFRFLVAPAMPTGLVAKPDDGHISLSWDDPQDESITHYEYRLRAGADPWKVWKPVPKSNAATIGYLKSTLTNGMPHFFQLRAVNNKGTGPLAEVGPVTPSLPFPNSPPKADAGPGQTVYTGTKVTLDGSRSSDPNKGDSLSYSWSQPDGALVSLSDVSISKPSFTAPSSAQTLRFELTVTDSYGESAKDKVTITVVPTPILQFQGFPIGNTLRTGSSKRCYVNMYDMPSDSGYRMRITAPQGAGLDASCATKAITTPIFTPSAIDQDFDYYLGFDLHACSAPGGKVLAELIRGSAVVASISRDLIVNDPPTADAGPGQTVNTGTEVTLDGSRSSDPNKGDSLSYSWSQPDGTRVTLSSVSASQPSFTAPSSAQTLRFELTVTDSYGESAKDKVTITVVPTPSLRLQGFPTGNTLRAGSSKRCYVNVHNLPSDIGYRMRITTPQGAGLDASCATKAITTPNFIPDTLGRKFDYYIGFDLHACSAPGGKVLAELIRGSAVVASISRDLTVAVPTADAGPDQTVNTGTKVTLDGSRSSDPDKGDKLSYKWSQPHGTQVTLSSVSASQPSFTAPSNAQTLRFELTVTDSYGESAKDSVTITVVNPRLQFADFPIGNTLRAGSSKRCYVNVHNLPTDSGYRMRITTPQGAGLDASCATKAITTPNFTSSAIDQDFDYYVGFDLHACSAPGGKVLAELIRGSAVVASISRDLIVNDPPTADAGPGQTVNAGTKVTLDGSRSSDPNKGDKLSYSWSQPDGALVSLSSVSASQPSFTAPSNAQTLRFELTVTDSYGESAKDSVTITVVNPRLQFADFPIGNTLRAGSSKRCYVNVHNLPTDSGYRMRITTPQGAGLDASCATKAITTPNFTSSAIDQDFDYYVGFDLHACSAPGGKVLAELIRGSAVVASISRDLIVNDPPNANAGSNQTVNTGTKVTLDGSRSSDPDKGDKLSYKWSQSHGTQVTLSSVSASQPSFTAPSSAQTLRFELTVTDSYGESAKDSVTITVIQPNRAPIARAGSNQTVSASSIVTLSGSGSSDPDGDRLRYIWSQTSGTQVTLRGWSSAHPYFSAPSSAARLVFRLTVVDADRATDTDSVTITVLDPPVNKAPIADAGKHQTANVGDKVDLDGSGSSDPDGDSLSYRWMQTDGTRTTLGWANTATPFFIAKGAGNHSFQLTVTDSHGASDTDSVSITVAQPNRAPIAKAGSDRTVKASSTVTLSGLGSSDPDGDSLRYLWRQTAGTQVTLSSVSASRPRFTAPSSAQTLRFELTVRDGRGGSDTDSVTITVAQPNRAPIARAGSDRTVKASSTVTLSGLGSSDPDGDNLRYLWRQTAGTQVTLSSVSASRPRFTAPSSAQTLRFELTVRDGRGGSDTDSVTITVARPNRAPIARAGSNQTVSASSIVTLSGSGSSDPDGDSLRYIWSQTSGTQVTLRGWSSAHPYFSAPSSAARLVFRLTVVDADRATDTDSVTITVLDPPVNKAPIADAGKHQTANVGDKVDLDGSGSSDPDGDSLSYRWMQTDGTRTTLGWANTATPFFIAKGAGNHSFQLTVTDSHGASNTDSVSVTVSVPNEPPVANAGPDKTVIAGEFVRLYGSGSDPDGDTLSYKWTQTSGATISIGNSTSASLSFTAPLRPALLVFRLTVTDTHGASDTDDIRIRVIRREN